MLEIKYKPGLLRTVRSECTENAGSLDSVINEVLLEELEDKPVLSAVKTLSDFQVSLQQLGATLAREVRLLESMQAKAAHFRIDFNLDAKTPGDPSPRRADVLQTTPYPQISMFRSLCARYPTVSKECAAIISYGPPLLRRIHRRCSDDAASQALTINDILQDQFAIESTPIKIEILTNFERHLRSVSASLVWEVTILNSMERQAAALREHYEPNPNCVGEADKEILGKGEGDAQENECLSEPISPNNHSSKSPPPTQENAEAEDTGEDLFDWHSDAPLGSEDLCDQDGSREPPTTPQEVLNLLKLLPLRAATLKGYDFNFTKAFMKGVLQLCCLILELDVNKFANGDAKRIIDACFKAAGQPYELVFYDKGSGYLKPNFAKLPDQGSARESAASVAPDAFERSVLKVGKIPDHEEVEEIIDSIEQVSPSSDCAANRTAWKDSDDVIVTDTLDTGAADAQSAQASILAVEHVLDARYTDASVGPIPVVDTVHGLPIPLARPSLDEREEDVLRRFSAEYDLLESPNDSYLVAGTFDERRKRRELAEQALEILLPRNGNTDEESHSIASIAETSIKHHEPEPVDSSTARLPSPAVPSKKRDVGPSIYDTVPPPQEASLDSNIPHAQIRTHNSLKLGQSSQMRRRSLSTLATKREAFFSPVSRPENTFDNGGDSNDQVVNGEGINVAEDRGPNPIEENVTRDELFATIERNWGASIDDVCTRPLWRRVPGRGLLKLLVRLSEVCALNDANAQLRVEIRARRKRDPNLLYVNESVLRSLVAANEPSRTQRPTEEVWSSSADSPRSLSQIGSAEDGSVSVGNPSEDGEREAVEEDHDENTLAEQQCDVEDDGPRKNRYTSKDVALLIRLKKEGKSWREIGEVFKPFHRTLASLQFKWWSLRTQPKSRVRTMSGVSRQTLSAEPHEHDTNASPMDESGLSKGGHVRSPAANESGVQELGETLRQHEIPAFTKEIPESGHRRSRERGRRNRYTSEEIELLLRLKQENKTWLQIEESFKDTTHTMRSLQSKYSTLKPDMNDAMEQVSEYLHEPPSDEPSTGEHINIIAETSEEAATGAVMGGKEQPKVVFATESGPVTTSPSAPVVPVLDLTTPDPSLATTLSSRLPMAFNRVMNSPDYGCFKVTMDKHEGELPEGQFYRVVAFGTEKLERENVQSAERLEDIADALWVSIISHASSSLEDKWMAIEALDRALTYYVVSHGGLGLIDIRKKMLTRKFGRTRKACTTGTHYTSEILREMLDANPRPEKRGSVEGAVKIAHTYIGNAQTVVEVEMRAYDLFEAIIDGCRHNSKVKQSAISSIIVALKRCLDAVQNRELPQDDVTTQLSEATGDEAASIQGILASTEEAQLPSPPAIDDEPRQPKLSMRENFTSNNQELRTQVLTLEPMDSEDQPLGSQTDLDGNTMPGSIITKGPSDATSGKSAIDLQISEAVSSTSAKESPTSSATSSPRTEARDGITGFDDVSTNAPSTLAVICEDEDDSDRRRDLPRSRKVLHKPKQYSPANSPSNKPSIGTLRPQTTVNKDNEAVEASVEVYTTPGKLKSLSERIKHSKSSQISQNEYGARHLRPLPSDKAEMHMKGTSHKRVNTDDESVELSSKVYKLSDLNKNRKCLPDSANDGLSNNVTMSPVPAPSAAMESLNATSMHTARPPPSSAEFSALASAHPPFLPLPSQEVPAMEAPLLNVDEVKQVIDAILHHPISKARKFAFDLVTKVLEGRNANTLAKAQAIDQLLYKGFKEYGGKDDNTSSGYVGLREAVREHVQNKALNKRCPDHKVSDNHATTSNISRGTLPERHSSKLAAPNLPIEPSSGSASKMQRTPEPLKSYTGKISQTDAHGTAADMLAANPDPSSRATNLSQVDIALKFLKARGPDSMAALEDTAFELVKCIDVARKRSYPVEAQYCAEDSVHQAMAIYIEQNRSEQRDVAVSAQGLEARRATAGQASESVPPADLTPCRTLGSSLVSSNTASVEKEIAACARATNSEHGCSCQIHAFIRKWFLEGTLLALNEFGSIQLSTFLHTAEYRPLAVAMIVDQNPDMAQYYSAFATILCMALVEDTFKSCYRVGLAPRYIRPKESVERPASPPPANYDAAYVDDVRFNSQTPQAGPTIAKVVSPTDSAKTLMRRQSSADIRVSANKHVLNASTAATFIPKDNACEVMPREGSLGLMEDGSTCLDASPDVLAGSRLFSDRLFNKDQANLADIAGSGKPSPVQSHTLAQDAASLEDRTAGIQPSSDFTNKAKTQPVASMQSSLPARPSVVWNGSAFAISESTKHIPPESVSETLQQPLSATRPEQSSPVIDEHVRSNSLAPLSAKSRTMADSSDTATVHDRDRCEAIEILEKAFVRSLNELKDIDYFNGQEPKRTARALALSLLEQVIHNSPSEKYVYLRQVRTYFNAIDGYAGWTKRLLDDPKFVEMLSQMAAEKLSKDTRLAGTQYSRMTEELVAKQHPAVENATAQTSPLLTTRQDQRPIASQCSPAQPQPSNVKGSPTRSSWPANGNASSEQDSLTRAPYTPGARSSSRKRASSTTLKTSPSKRKVTAVSPERHRHVAYKETTGSREYTPSELMPNGGISTSSKPRRKQATRTPTNNIQKPSPKATGQPPTLAPTLSEQSTAAKAAETEVDVLAETSRTVTTSQSAQTSSLSSGHQHEAPKISQCERPSLRAKHSAARPHNSGPSPRASATPVPTPQHDLQTTYLTDKAASTVLPAGQDYRRCISQVPGPSPAVLPSCEYQSHCIRSPPIPSQPPATPPSAVSFYNKHALSPKANMAIKHIIHDLSPLPELSAEGIPTAYDDTYEEYPPGLNIEAPTRQASPFLMSTALSNALPLDRLDPSGFAFVQNERGEVNRETWGFVTRQTPMPTLAFPAGGGVGFERRKVRMKEREWLEERAMKRCRNENGEIKEEALIVPLDLWSEDDEIMR